MSVDINDLQAALAAIQAKKAAATQEPDPVTSLDYARQGARFLSPDAITNVIQHIIAVLTEIESKLSALSPAQVPTQTPTDGGASAVPVTDSTGAPGARGSGKPTAPASGSASSPN